ncbi:MAG: pimeloyl-[acyl-carrier protein] methyl ester esterase [Acidobacteriota bacterium]|jgi:pimeloyl-ACP methyl ester carboxylesterase|nr:pimeloyl-[acyl-carrier protein] methyl ester esterase [Acidobacteriota bacterium]
MTFVIFPGLDGTSLLLREFTALADALVIEYPRDEVLSYDALAARASGQLPERPVIIGESFGGAIAVLVASRASAQALVLVNSFIVPPLPRALAWLPIATLLRIQPPESLLAWWIADGSREAVSSVSREVLASRIRMALSVDVRKELESTTMPLFDLRSRGDRLVGTRSREHVIKARPDARTAVIDGPHALLFGEPAAAWDAIRRFIC